MKIKLVAIGLTFALSTQLSVWAGSYEQCIKDNLEKAKNEAAVNLLKEICASEAEQTKNPCKSKKPGELTDEELCKCIGSEYDTLTKKCK